MYGISSSRAEVGSLFSSCSLGTKPTVHNLSFPLLSKDRSLWKQSPWSLFVSGYVGCKATATLNSFVKDKKSVGIFILTSLTPDIPWNSNSSCISSGQNDWPNIGGWPHRVRSQNPRRTHRIWFFLGHLFCLPLCQLLIVPFHTRQMSWIQVFWTFPPSCAKKPDRPCRQLKFDSTL